MAHPINAWMHVVAVAHRTTGELRVYRNGQLAQRQTGSALAIPDHPDVKVTIGSDANGTNPFAGAIDDLLFLDRALSDTEVARWFAVTVRRRGRFRRAG